MKYMVSLCYNSASPCAVHRGVPLDARLRRAHRLGFRCRHARHGGRQLDSGEVISGFFKPDANFEDSFLRVVSGKRLLLRFGNCSLMAKKSGMTKVYTKTTNVKVILAVAVLFGAAMVYGLFTVDSATDRTICGTLLALSVLVFGMFFVKRNDKITVTSKTLTLEPAWELRNDGKTNRIGALSLPWSAIKTIGNEKWRGQYSHICIRTTDNRVFFIDTDGYADGTFGPPGYVLERELKSYHRKFRHSSSR